MHDERTLSRIEANCNQLLNSPYLQKEVPIELKNLRIVLEKINLLIRDDVPILVSEIRHLRTQNRKLEAELQSLRAQLAPEPEPEPESEPESATEPDLQPDPEPQPEPSLPNP